MPVLSKIRPLTSLITYAIVRLTSVRLLSLGWLLTTQLYELNCALSDTKFLIAHFLVVVVAEYSWYSLTRHLSEGLMLARKNPLNTLSGPSRHLRSILGLPLFIIHLIQLIKESRLMLKVGPNHPLNVASMRVYLCYFKITLLAFYLFSRKLA